MRIFILILVLACSLAAMAQEKNVVSATMYYNEYMKSRDEKDLQRAKAKTDAAAVHPETKDLAKTWVIRGKIYFALYMAELGGLMQESTAMGAAEKRDEAYQKAADTLLAVAGTSFMNGKRLDTSSAFTEDLSKGINDCYATSANSGVANYHNGNPAKATDCFFRAYVLSTSLDKLDTLMLYNAALSAYTAKLFERAILISGMLTTYGHEQSEVWWILTESYVQSGDTVKAREAIHSGLAKFPGDQRLKWAYLDVLLAAENFGAADEYLRVNHADAGHMADAQTLLIIGNVYDQLANPTGSDGSELPKPWNYEVLCERAEINYRKALEVKPDHFQARYNLAVLYYNQGVHYFNRSVEEGPEGERCRKIWPGFMTKAKVEFEAARLLNPDDLDTLRGLKMCYAQLGETENYREVKERIGQLEK